jgi:predicted DNA-binding protein
MGLRVAKPAASLSAHLLARKGEARPSGNTANFGGIPLADEMRRLADQEAERLEAQALIGLVEKAMATPAFEPELVPTPEPVVAAEPMLAPPAEPAPIVPAAAAPADDTEPTIAGAVRGKARAAFTLRLDPERHLRLRLASAHQHRSSQQIVVEALDRYLEQLPALAAAVSACPRSAPSTMGTAA